jgi:tetratricopeptide (TPR) repeat protein
MDADAHAQMGSFLHSLAKKLPEAASEYERAAQISPNSDRVYRAWGDVMRDEGDWFGAAEKYQWALEINPHQHVGFSFMDAVADNPGAISDEINAFKSTKDPRFAATYLDWGTQLYVSTFKNQDQESLIKLRTAMRLDPNLIDACVLSSQILENLKRSKEAQVLLKDAIHAHPHNSALFTAWANLLDSEGQRRQAVSIYYTALGLAKTPSERAKIYWMLCADYFLLKETKQANIMKHKAEQIAPISLSDIP